MADSPMIVLLTGMVRSGSTWAFNVAKALLMAETRAITGEYTNDVGAAIAGLGTQVEHHLIKAHMVDRVGHMLIRHRMCKTICTWREPLDCIASSVQAFGSDVDDTIALAQGGLAFLDLQAREGGVLFIAHDTILAQPHDAIRAIAAYLGCAADDATVGRIGGLFSKDNVARFTDKLERAPDARSNADGWDRDTLFHPGHIRAHPRTPEQLLTPAQLSHAITALGPLVDAHGRLMPELKARLAITPGTAAAA
jgi:hypothetical protein